MIKRENRGPSGRIEIEYEWEESSSGHIESCKSVELVTEGENIILKETKNYLNYSKSSESRKSLDCIEIDVNTLIIFIRKNGRKLKINDDPENN